MMQDNNNLFKDLLITQGISKELEKSIDIYSFFDVVCNLFEKLESLRDDNNQKMNFRVIYPDEEFKDDAVNVTYDIVDRRTLSLPLSSGETLQKKARLYPQTKDIITDQIEGVASHSYTNFIKLTVHSTSYKELIRTVKFIESVFIKHKGILKQSVQDVSFIELSETQFSENIYKQRFYSKALIYKVVTVEMYKLLYEELQQISISN